MPETRKPNNANQNIAGHQFVKGQSGNPGGRPKEKLITGPLIRKCEQKVAEFFTTDEIAKYKLERFVLAKATIGELMADRMIRAGIAGNSDGTRILREIMDRIEGRVPLPLMGVEGGEFVLNLVSHIPRPDRSPGRPQKAAKKVAKNVQ